MIYERDPHSAAIQELFLAWHLKHIDPEDAADATRHVKAAVAVQPGARALRDELRPRILSAFDQLARADARYLLDEITDELVHLCEPQGSGIYGAGTIGSLISGLAVEPGADDAVPELQIRERNLRARIVVELVLACAPYMDVQNRLERQAIVDAITTIHSTKGAAGRHGSTIEEVLVDFLSTTQSEIRTDGQVLAVASLVEISNREDTVALLLRIARNRGRRYDAPVQLEATVALAVLAARARNPLPRDVYTAIADYIRMRGARQPDEVRQILDERLGDLLTEAGEPMLEELIGQLTHYWSKQNRLQLRNQRRVLNQAVLNFGEPALRELLHQYYEFRDEAHAAIPLLKTLESLAVERHQLWARRVALPEHGREASIVECLAETVREQWVGAYVAAEALGRLTHLPRVRQLLWETAQDTNASSRVRATCLWSLVEYGRSTPQGLTELCDSWLKSNVYVLKSVAALVLHTMGREDAKATFVELLVTRSADAEQWCYASPQRTIPLLTSMLNTQNRGIALRILPGLGYAGGEALVDAYIATRDTEARVQILAVLEHLPASQLHQYRALVDAALTSGAPPEREPAIRLAQRLGSKPLLA